jgi:hypothetical protein
MVFVGIGERDGVRSHAAIDRSGLAAGNCADVFSPFAWGDVGHCVICRIANEEVKPAIKARVDALVAI